MAEEKPITVDELLNQGNNLKALQQYSIDKNKSFETAGDLLSNFMEDYRGMHVNSYKTAEFLSYANTLDEQPEYKKDLGALYKAVDDQLENEVTGEAVIDYTKYLLTDPLNLLGFGAGKAIGMAVARPLVQKLVTSSLAQAATKTPVRAAATGAALPEVIAAPVQETLVQQTEKDLGVKEEINLAEIGIATAVGVTAAAGFGAAGGLLVDKIRKSRGDKQAEKVIEQLESSTQGQAAKAASIAEAPTESGGLYVTLSDDITKNIDDYETFDTMGRILPEKASKEGDIVVELIAKSSKESVKQGTPSRVKVEIAADQLSGVKAVSEVDKLTNIANYVKKEEFFDRTSIQEANDFFNDTVDSEVWNKLNQRFSPTISAGAVPDEYINIEMALGEVYKKNKELLDPYIDLRANKTEQISSIAAGLDANNISLPDEMTGFLKEVGLDTQQFLDYYRWSSHNAAVTLAKKANLDYLPKTGAGSSLISKLSNQGAIPLLANKESALDSAAKAVADQLRKEDIQAQKAGKILSGGVDFWRSIIVSSPATTMRNIVGSLANTPGASVRQVLDSLFINTERQILGLPEVDPKDQVKNKLGDMSVRLLDAESSVALTDIVANVKPEVRRAFNDNFGDSKLLNTDVEESSTLKSFKWIGRKLNVLNIQQDRAFKAAAFLSSAQAQINRKINLGLWTEEIKTIEELIAKNRLDLFDEDMTARALQTAYDITFQTRNAGDKLFNRRGLGQIVNLAQRTGAQNTLVKLVVPFANFMANMFVFSSQRMGLFAPKMLVSGNRVLSAKREAPAISEKFIKLKEARGNLNPKDLRQIPPELDKKYVANGRVDTDALDKDIKAEQEKLGEYLRSLEDLKDSLREAFDFSWMLGTALALRASFGGDTYYELKSDEGDSVDVSPMFPLPMFLFIANYVLEQIDPEKAVRIESPAKEILKLTTGIEGRQGVLKGTGDLAQNIANQLRDGKDDPEALAIIGKSLAALMTSFLGGFSTPFRVVEDVYSAGVGPSPSYDPRLKNIEFFDPEDLADSEINQMTSAFLNKMIADITKGTGLERVIYEGSPENYSITELGVERKADVPGLKQLTGATPKPRKTRMQAELDQQGVEAWKLRSYSEVEEYDSIFNKALGYAIGTIEDQFLNSREYVNAPRYRDKNDTLTPTKAEMLEALYKGTEKVGSPAFRNVFSFLFPNNKTPTSAHKYASQFMEERFPGLSALKKFKGRVSKDDESRIFEEIKKEPGGLQLISRINKPKFSSDLEDTQLTIDVEKLQEVYKQLKARGALPERTITELGRNS